MAPSLHDFPGIFLMQLKLLEFRSWRQIRDSSLTRRTAVASILHTQVVLQNSRPCLFPLSTWGGKSTNTSISEPDSPVPTSLSHFQYCK
jgi:hypothetical protein